MPVFSNEAIWIPAAAPAVHERWVSVCSRTKTLEKYLLVLPHPFGYVAFNKSTNGKPQKGLARMRRLILSPRSRTIMLVYNMETIYIIITDEFLEHGLLEISRSYYSSRSVVSKRRCGEARRPVSDCSKHQPPPDAERGPRIAKRENFDLWNRLNPSFEYFARE